MKGFQRHAYGDQFIPDDKLNRLINLYDAIVDEGIFIMNICLYSLIKRVADEKHAARVTIYF